MFKSPLRPLPFVALLLMACSSENNKADSADSQSIDLDTSEEQSLSSLEPGVNELTIEQLVDGETVERRVLVHTPEDFDASQSLPLLFAFHGAGSDGERYVNDLGPRIDESGFVGVYPDGISQSWNIGPEESTADDVAFTESILAALEGVAGITTERPVAMGFSNGSAMVHKLAMNTNLFAAIVPQSSALTQADLPESTDAKVSVLQFHGTEDFDCPYDGGVGVLGHDFLAAEESAATWAAHNGCDATAVETQHNNGLVTRFEWPNCDEGRAVVHYKLGAIGHSLPPDVDGDTYRIVFDFITAAR